MMTQTTLSRDISKHFSKLASSFIVGSSLICANVTHANEDDAKDTITKDLKVETSNSTAFWNGLFWDFDLSKSATSVDVIFDNQNTHILRIHPMESAKAKHCNAVIKAVDTTTGKITRIFDNAWGKASDDGILKEGQTRSRTIDKVRYDFKFLSCGAKNYRMEITRDLSEHPSYKNQPRNLTDLSSLTWEMTGFKREIPLREPEIIEVVRGASPTVGNEITTSREVGFSFDEGTGQSVGVNVKILQGALQQSVNRSKETKFEQAETSINTLTLDWNVCNTWRLDRTQTVELGHVTAPEFGITDPMPFTVFLSQKIEAQSLCEEGSNIASLSAIEQEKRKIKALNGPS